MWKASVDLLTYLLMVVVVGVDVVVELLVPHVLLVAQLAVKVGVSLLLQGGNTHRRRQMNTVYFELATAHKVGKQLQFTSCLSNVRFSERSSTQSSV